MDSDIDSSDPFWREVNESVNCLRQDPAAWKDYKHEIEVLEGGSDDGLDDPYFTREEEAVIRRKNNLSSHR